MPYPALDQLTASQSQEMSKFESWLKKNKKQKQNSCYHLLVWRLIFMIWLFPSPKSCNLVESASEAGDQREKYSNQEWRTEEEGKGKWEFIPQLKIRQSRHHHHLSHLWRSNPRVTIIVYLPNVNSLWLSLEEPAPTYVYLTFCDYLLEKPTPKFTVISYFYSL